MRWTILLVGALVIVKAGFFLWLRHMICQVKQSDNSYSYVGRDYPRLWSIPEPDMVRMFIEDTVRYQARGDDANSEWAALTPNDGIIYLGEEHRPFSVSMFHQIRCLDIFRRELLHAHSPDKNDTSELGRHCLNYLRQMILCTSDTRLDTLLGRPEVQAFPDIYECRDWNVIYEAVQENHKGYVER